MRIRIFGRVLGLLVLFLGCSFLLSTANVSTQKDYHIGIANTAQEVKAPTFIDVRNRSGTPANAVFDVGKLNKAFDPNWDWKHTLDGTDELIIRVNSHSGIDPDFLRHNKPGARSSPTWVQAKVIYNSADVGGVSGNDGLVRIRTG